MLYTEFNMEDALAVRYEEGIAIGDAIGEKRGIAIGQENKEKEKEEAVKEFKDKIFALWENGMSLDEAKQKLGI